MSQQTLTKPSPLQNRKVRVIHESSFGTFERENCWTWTVDATWWHQKFLVMGFHRSILFGERQKSTHPQAPTVDSILAELQKDGRHSWEKGE